MVTDRPVCPEEVPLIAHRGGQLGADIPLWAVRGPSRSLGRLTLDHRLNLLKRLPRRMVGLASCRTNSERLPVQCRREPVGRW